MKVINHYNYDLVEYIECLININTFDNKEYEKR